MDGEGGKSGLRRTQWSLTATVFGVFKAPGIGKVPQKTYRPEPQAKGKGEKVR